MFRAGSDVSVLGCMGLLSASSPQIKLTTGTPTAMKVADSLSPEKLFLMSEKERDNKKNAWEVLWSQHTLVSGC